MALPETCHQSARPGGCQRGGARRYASNDLELCLLEDLTRRCKKIRPSRIRPGKVDFGPSKVNETLAPEQKSDIARETGPPP